MKITRTKNVKGSTSTKRTIGAGRVGKTKEVIVLQGNYGYGWDDLAEYDTNQLREVKKDLKAYRENERNASHRTIRRRVPNPNWVDPAKGGMAVESSTSTKRKYTVGASENTDEFEDVGFTQDDAVRFERERFAENLVKDLESEYSVKVSQSAWGEIMDLARDLGFGADAERHGSTPQYILEDAIYDIVEEDTGIVIGFTDIKESVDIDTMRDRFLNPEDFVFFFNGKEMYRGDGDGFSNVIADLCKDESMNQKFQEWCNQFGDPFDFNGSPNDTAFVFTWLVGQERMEQDDFYLDGDGILNFEIFNVSDMIKSSTNVATNSDEYGFKTQIDDPEDLLMIADQIAAWSELEVSVTYADTTSVNDWTVFIEVDASTSFKNFENYIYHYHKDMYNALNTQGSGIDSGCIDAWGWDCELTQTSTINRDGDIQIYTDREYYDKSLVDQLCKIRNEYADFVASGLKEVQSKLGNCLLDYATFYASADITASIGRPDPTDDKEYYEQLAKGAVDEYNVYWNSDATYEITDSAITFIDGENAIYVQPLENITPNWDDLSDDIAELGNALIGEMLPF